MVEFALVVMLLATVAFGTLEYGYGWRSSMSVLTAARAGARTVASMGTDAQADYLALTSIRTNLDSAGLLEGLEAVIIYRADAANGDVPPACINKAPAANDKCNHFTGNQVRSVQASQFSSSTGCMTSAPIAKYCPNARVTAQGTADNIGVWVQARQKSLTMFFGGKGFLAARDAVMRMEPS
jgi:Flp pilus assembly protein TadG